MLSCNVQAIVDSWKLGGHSCIHVFLFVFKFLYFTDERDCTELDASSNIKHTFVFPGPPGVFPGRDFSFGGS